jgi:hypothetical protein
MEATKLIARETIISMSSLRPYSCDELTPGMDIDAVPAGEICSVRQLALVSRNTATCMQYKLASARLASTNEQDGDEVRKEQLSCTFVEDYMASCLDALLQK